LPNAPLQLLLDNFAEMAPIIYTPTVSKEAAHISA
jgi:malic enzyme